MALSVEIRRAEAADAAAVAAIYNQAVLTTTATFDTEPRSDVQQADWLRAHGDRHAVLVAVVAGRVVGWASLSRWSERPAYRDTAESSVYIDAAHRGRGIGRTLYTALIGAAREAGFHTLLARVAAGGEASLRLHERVGFRPVGTLREVGRKFGRLLDVQLLQLMLTETDARPG